MSQPIDSPIVVLFEDRPKQGMVFQLNLSVYLDARVVLAKSLKDLKKALAGPDGIHLVVARAQFKGSPIIEKIMEFLGSSKAPVPVISLGDAKEQPGLVVLGGDGEVKPLLQSAARILGITAKQMVSKQRSDTYEIAPEFLNMLFTFPCDVFDRGVGGVEKIFSAGDVVPRNKVSVFVQEKRLLVVDAFQRLKLANAVTEQSLKASEELETGNLSDGKKMAILASSLDMVSAQFQNAGMDEETVKLANASILAVEKIAESASSVGNLVKQLLEAKGGYRYAHCQLVTFLGFHVIKMMGWWGDEQRQIISQAAFYHDISLTTDAQAQIRSAKALGESPLKDPQFEELLLTHPQMAARELQAAPEISPEVVRVVIQHHGSPVGRGFSTDIAKFDNLTKTFILAEEWCDYLMDLAQSDRRPDNASRIQELKAIYKDEQCCQIVETFRYLDPEEFANDFLSTKEVDFGASLIAGGGAGSEAESVVVLPSAAEEKKDTLVKGGQPEAEENTLVKGGPAEAEHKQKIAGVTEVRQDEKILVKAGKEEALPETRIAPDNDGVDKTEKRFSSESSSPDNDLTVVKGGPVEAEHKQTIEGVTDVRLDEKILVKGEAPQDLVDRSIVKIKAEAVDKEKELKMKALAGSTDLMKAALGGAVDKIIELLAANSGVELRKTDAEGRTAIHYGAMGGSVPALTLLLEKGAAINSSDSKRRSALFFAALYKHNDAFDFLLAHGSKISQQAMGGMTIAMIGAFSGNMHILKIAVEKGVRVDSKDHNGKTAMDFAKQAKNAEAIAFLESLQAPKAPAPAKAASL